LAVEVLVQLGAPSSGAPESLNRKPNKPTRPAVASPRP
jgi:hypothetical protein